MRQHYTLADKHQQIQDIKELNTLLCNTLQSDKEVYKQYLDNLRVMRKVLQHIIEDIAVNGAARPATGVRAFLRARRMRL